MINIIADNKIPLPANFLGNIGTLKRLATENINATHLKNADALLVRSVTKVNVKLLQNTPIKFVATASAGMDNLDIEALNTHNIAWSHAPGCNANAVRDYVLCAIAALEKSGHLNTKKRRAGVLGVGEVGRRVVTLLEKLGFKVLQNDPLRVLNEPGYRSTELSAFQDLDLICCHTPLTFDGQFPTHHLIDDAFLSQQKEGCVILNAGRGAVINTQAIKNNKHLNYVFDVWENEPNVDLDLLEQAKIATPHIAGYSKAAKYRAGYIMINALCAHFNVEPRQITNTSSLSNLTTSIDLDHPQNFKKILQTENLCTLSEHFKQTLLKHPKDIGQQFKQSRQTYLLRTEFIL
jgi:erythronate-4-phosphate dehydrogenase